MQIRFLKKFCLRTILDLQTDKFNSKFLNHALSLSLLLCKIQLPLGGSLSILCNFLFFHFLHGFFSSFKLSPCGESFSFSPQRCGKAVKKISFPRIFHSAKKRKFSFSTIFPRSKNIFRHTFPHSLGKLCGKNLLPANAVLFCQLAKFQNFLCIFL